MNSSNKDHLALFLGLIAVTCFGLTLPMTRYAVTQLDPIVVGIGRAFLASIIAGLILLRERASWPKRDQLVPLAIVGICISILFPMFVAYAMRYLPASHGAIVIGLLPIATTYAISLMNHENPSRSFWFASLLGGITVVGYAILRSGGVLHVADILLLATVVVGALGYAHGAILAKKIGGMKVMCWALVLMMPFLAIGSIPHFLKINPSEVSLSVWGSFIYLSLISQFFGMALWYKALSMGSVVKVSQVQLLQPFFTIIFSGLFFGEYIDSFTWGAAVIVVLSIQLSRNAVVEINTIKKTDSIREK